MFDPHASPNRGVSPSRSRLSRAGIAGRLFTAQTLDVGSGISLAVARAIIDVHKGRITAASDCPGTGATFTTVVAES